MIGKALPFQNRLSVLPNKEILMLQVSNSNGENLQTILQLFNTDNRLNHQSQCNADTVPFAHTNSYTYEYISILLSPHEIQQWNSLDACATSVITNFIHLLCL